MLDLKFVSKVYGFWGRFPTIYNLSNLITYIGKEKYLRWRTISKLNLLKGSVVLDLACGNGSNFKILETYIGKKGWLSGFDFSVDMLQSAHKRIESNKWRNVRLKQGDAANLPYEDAYFDGIVSSLGVSAIPDFKAALEHGYRVLRKGGRMAILDAKLFEGPWRVLNPAIKIIYSIGASWDYTKDIVGEFNKLFMNVQLEKYNAGTLYVLTGEK